MPKKMPNKTEIIDVFTDTTSWDRAGNYNPDVKVWSEMAVRKIVYNVITYYDKKIKEMKNESGVMEK